MASTLNPCLILALSFLSFFNLFSPFLLFFFSFLLLSRSWLKLVSGKAWFPYDRPDRPDRPSRLKKCSSDRDDHMETLPGRSQTIANDPDDRDDRSRSGRSWKIRSDQMETLSDDRSLSQKASFPSPFFALSREDCLGVREFSPKWRQRRSSTLLYLWKRYRNTSARTTNFQRIIRTSSHDWIAGRKSAKNLTWTPLCLRGTLLPLLRRKIERISK